MTTMAFRARYVSDSITTASPARLLTMLYDRLVLDLEQAEQAQRDGDLPTANAKLQHAQDIVLELQSSLDTSAWDGASSLASIYAFLVTELVQANVTRDADRTATCRALVQPLRDAWHQAAAQVAGAGDAAS